MLDADDVLAELQGLIDAEDEAMKKMQHGWVCRERECSNLNPTFRARCNRCGVMPSPLGGRADPMEALLFQPAPQVMHPGFGRFTNPDTEQCPICLTNLSEEENDPSRPDGWAELISAWRDTWVTLPCSHRMCAQCFSRYVAEYARGTTTMQSANGAGGRVGNVSYLRRYLSCLRCSQEVGQEIVRANVTEAIYTDYLRATLRVALAGFGPLLTRCPGVDCDYALLVADAPGDKCALPVMCPCGVSFCSGCGEKWEDRHAILTCAQFRLSSQSLDDAQSDKWKQKQTKQCPGCYVSVEKNEGCSHMTCKWCAHQWCWNCSGVYSSSHICSTANANAVTLLLRAAPPQQQFGGNFGGNFGGGNHFGMRLEPPRQTPPQQEAAKKKKPPQPKQWWHDDPSAPTKSASLLTPIAVDEFPRPYYRSPRLRRSRWDMTPDEPSSVPATAPAIGPQQPPVAHRFLNAMGWRPLGQQQQRQRWWVEAERDRDRNRERPRDRDRERERDRDREDRRQGGRRRWDEVPMPEVAARDERQETRAERLMRLATQPPTQPPQAPLYYTAMTH